MMPKEILARMRLISRTDVVDLSPTEVGEMERTLRVALDDAEALAVTPRPQGALVARTYTIMEQAVADGVRAGWNRAHKHTTVPDEELVTKEVLQAVMLCITEVFAFADPL